jgi:hypothetical protein
MSIGDRKRRVAVVIDDEVGVWERTARGHERRSKPTPSSKQIAVALVPSKGNKHWVPYVASGKQIVGS